MIKCVECSANACEGDINRTPQFCPRRHARDGLDRAQQIRTTDQQVLKVAEVAESVAKDGYRRWPRVMELMEFAKRMGFRRLGVAFCAGLKEETRALCRILESQGFEVVSVACTVEGGCNPVGQAMVLNQAGTELNIVVGLCMGHDILFSKFSEAPLTTLVVKDRVTGHNTVAPLVCGYWRKALMKSDVGS
ncbi:MAG: hypothetical protein DRP94_04145 [Candidatus Latescibacterota bacterium]|nr:MAG: hypothetical protein DRP94_04145 [Candidatus Latescibacterota bacterium]RKY67380.1 MAG: hypothetical protein DRQ08_00030 [Candidatus Latescibacterota bacterium]RKY73346.1 MAG: hypothetical protein DRQ14_04430 [Candidatus Latescibacterota bacterium]